MTFTKFKSMLNTMLQKRPFSNILNKFQNISKVNNYIRFSTLAFLRFANRRYNLGEKHSVYVYTIYTEHVSLRYKSWFSSINI